MIRVARNCAASAERLCTVQLSFSSSKHKVVPYSITSVRHGADPGLLAVSPQVIIINPVVGCRYFSPDPRLLSQPKRSLSLAGAKLYCLVTEAQVNSLPKATSLRNGAQPGLESATCTSQVRCPTNSATASPSSKHRTQKMIDQDSGASDTKSLNS